LYFFLIIFSVKIGKILDNLTKINREKARGSNRILTKGPSSKATFLKKKTLKQENTDYILQKQQYYITIIIF